MADERRFELDDLLLRPGCYLNPQTEVMVVVDDSPSIDGEIFNMEEFEGADWVLIADEVPHVHNGVRWGSYLLGGSERAYREKVCELRAELDETGAPA